MAGWPTGWLADVEGAVLLDGVACGACGVHARRVTRRGWAGLAAVAASSWLLGASPRGVAAMAA